MATGQFVSARVTRRLDVEPERAFDAWLDPAKIRDWFGPGLGTMVRIDVEPHVGGTFCWVQRRGDADVEHLGEFVEMDPPRRLVFLFAVPPDPPSRVVVDIAPAGGGCDVTVTHEIPSESAAFVPKSVEAWGTMLDAMAKVA